MLDEQQNVLVDRASDARVGHCTLKVQGLRVGEEAEVTDEKLRHYGEW
jgi:hypothetical protein